MFHENKDIKCYMHDFAAAFWEHNIYKIPQRNLRPITVRIQVDIEGGTQDGVKSKVKVKCAPQLGLDTLC